MITSFSGQHQFLSNFWPAAVTLDGVIYPSVEHAYQASKFDDERIRLKMATYPGTVGGAAMAKRLGRNTPLSQDRRAWFEGKKQDIMLDLLRQKFKNPQLAKLLLATGVQELVEGNYWHDTTWGRCTCTRYGHENEGRNLLGLFLERVREELRSNILCIPPGTGDCDCEETCSIHNLPVSQVKP